MRFFLDTANLDEIRYFSEAGLIDGITTNPSIIAKSGQNILDTIKEIAQLVNGPISAEVTASDFQTQIKEAEKLADIAPNITIKVPLTPDGLRTCKHMSDTGRMVNATLCFSVSQALLAAKAGATFVSPFIGRIEDNGGNGVGLIRDIVETFRNYPDITTSVLASSIRCVDHVVGAAKAGADVATVPPKILHEMFKHPLTEQGVKLFALDWEKSKQSIL